MIPETRYATTVDGTRIAYQVLGTGPGDLVYVPEMASHLEHAWECPPYADLLRRLSTRSRLIMILRGTGLSDPVSQDAVPTLESRMSDVTAVLDVVGSERAVLFGVMEGGSTCALFAATYPQRAIGLILYGSLARGAWAPDYPWGLTDEQWREEARRVEETWETSYPEQAFDVVVPSLAGDDGLRRWFAEDMRRGTTASAFRSLQEMFKDLDIRSVLPAIQIPALVLHAKGDMVNPIEEGRYLADRIAGARFVELPGDDHLPWAGDRDLVLAEVDAFLERVGEEEAEFGRVLATVLFTDIVGSTAKAAALGDRKWKELLEAHHARIRGLLARYRGTEIDTAGDGFLATFEGPARAVRCASAIVDSLRAIGVDIRAGVHTGECELVDGKVRGIAVHTGARVAAQAGPGEVLVSSTVKDLVAGSGLRFEDRGTHLLKGLPDEWQLFAVGTG
ncbi:MAG: adenylate/guanylate cyclase domain-containing protein [Actinomycetota bacterium]|nr:adenylate/guanylate cyclase domain-containing protein [Actinomycetota bacterium]